MERLKKLEVDKLGKGVNSDMKQAGLNKLDVFGDFSLIDKVAGGDVLKYDQVLGLEYYVILNKLSLDLERSLFERRYNEVMIKKQKDGYK